MKSNLTVLLILAGLFFMNVFLFPVSLKPLQSIGDIRDNYTFFGVNDAVISENGDIFVLDAKGLFLAKYDPTGKFVKKVGKKGQGPGDFSLPNGLDIYNNKLLVADFLNKRLFVCSLNLDDFKYFPMPSISGLTGKTFFINDQKFMGVFTHLRRDFNRIAVFDNNGKVLHHFFSGYPVALDVDPIALSDQRNADIFNSIRGFMIGQETTPIIGVDKKNRARVLLTFVNPDNPMAFFVYSADGKLIRKFQHPLDKKYRFFDFYVKAKRKEDMETSKMPDRYFLPRLSALTIHKNYYLAQLSLMEFQKKDIVENRRVIIVFNDNGSFRGEWGLDTDEYFIGIAGDDLALTVKEEEECSVLRIQKMMF